VTFASLPQGLSGALVDAQYRSAAKLQLTDTEGSSVLLLLTIADVPQKQQGKTTAPPLATIEGASNGSMSNATVTKRDGDRTRRPRRAPPDETMEAHRRHSNSFNHVECAGTKG